MTLVERRGRKVDLHQGGSILFATVGDVVAIQYSAGILSVIKQPRAEVLKVTGGDVIGPSIRNLDNEWIVLKRLREAMLLEDLADV